MAAVFVLASVTKLLDPTDSRQALVNFGIPVRLAAPGGVLLPLAELTVAIALIPRTTAWWGALGALVLLLLFIIGMAVALARGKAPDCHCFGQLYSAPVGRSTLVRNIALACLAGFVLWQGWDDSGASAVEWVGNLSVAERVLLVAVALLTVGMIAVGWSLLQLMKQNGRLLLRLDDFEARIGTTGNAPAVPPNPSFSPNELPVGSVAPAFELSDLNGGGVTLADLLLPGTPLFLVFSDADCGSCTALLPEVAQWQQSHSQLTVALISRGSRVSNRAKLKDLQFRNFLLQRDREVAEAYGTKATPSAVIVQPDGTIGSRVAVGPVAIRTLIDPWMEESPRTAV